MVHQDEDYYGDYRIPDAIRTETSFAVPDMADTTSTLRLRQKVKRDKVTALYRHLNVKGNPELIDLDRSRSEI